MTFERLRETSLRSSTGGRKLLEQMVKAALGDKGLDSRLSHMVQNAEIKLTHGKFASGEAEQFYRDVMYEVNRIRGDLDFGDLRSAAQSNSKDRKGFKSFLYTVRTVLQAMPEAQRGPFAEYALTAAEDWGMKARWCDLALPDYMLGMATGFAIKSNAAWDQLVAGKLQHARRIDFYTTKRKKEYRQVQELELEYPNVRSVRVAWKMWDSHQSHLKKQFPNATVSEVPNWETARNVSWFRT